MNRLIRRPRPDFTTAWATRNAITTSKTLVFANPANAFAPETVLVSTTAPAANIVDVSSGYTPSNTETIAVTNTANRCHACGVRPAGTGQNQMTVAITNGNTRFNIKRGLVPVAVRWPVLGVTAVLMLSLRL